METFYTAQEVADLLKIKKTTVYDLIKKNRLPSSKVGKQIRISKTDLDAYLKQSSEGVRAAEVSGAGQDGAGSSVQPVSMAEAADNILRTRDYLQHNNGLIVSGQDELISVFCAYFQLEPDSLPVIQHSLNFYDSLYSLYFEKVHMAFVPVPRGFQDNPLHYLVPGISLTSVQVAEICYGLYVKKGNPRGIIDVNRLVSSDVCVMRGEKGSTCRIVLDKCMKEAGVDPLQVRFCSRENISALAAAAAVDSGQADAAVGSSSVLRRFPDLEFIPLQKADLKLVFHSRFLEHPAYQSMIYVIQSDIFRRRLMQMDGYECVETGRVEQV
ncbi:MAG: helix-turn-helix transcriptional regulator [Lachnospiraceae bacterium]|nr:helix-turn-helix transcriptional regulator [Lachnospiraceae bacterium]